MSDTQTVSIEVNRRTLKRFERARRETRSDQMPAMDADTFLSALLDTRKAVQRGYYGAGVQLSGVVQDSVDHEVVLPAETHHLFEGDGDE